MKFDSLYRIMINEAEAIEDTAELTADPLSTPAPELEGEGMDELAADVKPTTEDEMIDYLVQNSTIIGTGKGGRILTPTEKIKKAKDAIDNGFFDALYDGIQLKKAEKPAVEELPSDLESDLPTDDDMNDVPAVDEFRKEKEQEDLEADELSGQEI